MIYSEMQKSENNGEMQDSLLLLTIGENQVVESCDPEDANKVEKWMIQIMQVHQPSCK